MFGYVKPFKNELKVVENEVYKGMYCGLCKQLDKQYGFFSRFILNYDFAFMALVSASISSKDIEFKKEICIAHPLTKRTCCKSSEFFKAPCAISLLMLKYKLSDNFYDNGIKQKLVSALIYPFLYFSIRKAKRAYPKLDCLMNNMTKAQRKIEKSNSNNIDIGCEETAKALSELMPILYDGESQSQVRVLERLGYFIGRFVYMIDALDDIPQDIKSKSYNPFVLAYSISNDEELSSAVSEIVPSIYLTIGEITKTYELLEVKRFKGILDNIFYLGLKQTTDLVASKYKSKKETNNAKSL